MRSIEALENWYNTQSPKTKAYEYERHYRIIKKDLEVLEILKEYLTPHILEELCVEEKEVWEWLDEKD